MSSEETILFLDELSLNDDLHIIEDTLQGLAMRTDGTYLLTAFPTLNDFKYVVNSMINIPEKLISLLMKWEEMGSNEISIDFVKLIKPLDEI